MLLLSRFKPKPLVGLDIHTDEVRLVQLRRTKHCIYVEKVAFVELEPGTIIDGKIKKPTNIRDAIDYLVTRTKTLAFSAAIALPANSVITRRIKLADYLSDDEREAEINENLKLYFPGISADLCFDFINLGRSDVGYDDVLLAAVRQEQLNDYVNVVNQTGLNVKIVDIDSFALMRAISLFHSLQPVIAVLEVNPSNVQFIVFQNQDVLFSQQLAITDSEFEFIQQLKLVIQLCLSTHRHIQFDSLILCGKQRCLSDMAYLIQKECELKTQCANAFSTMMLSSTLDTEEIISIAPRMLVSCGLALRAIP